MKETRIDSAMTRQLQGTEVDFMEPIKPFEKNQPDTLFTEFSANVPSELERSLLGKPKNHGIFWGTLKREEFIHIYRYYR